MSEQVSEAGLPDQAAGSLGAIKASASRLQTMLPGDKHLLPAIQDNWPCCDKNVIVLRSKWINFNQNEAESISGKRLRNHVE